MRDPVLAWSTLHILASLLAVKLRCLGYIIIVRRGVPVWEECPA